MPKQTPLPWTLDVEYITRAKRGRTGFYVVRGPLGEYICTATKANAEFIVRACNGHAALISALAEIRHACRKADSNDAEHDALCDCDSIAQTALNAALPLVDPGNTASRPRCGKTAVAAYAAKVGADASDPGTLIDLVADLGHFAATAGHDFLGLLRTGVAHWVAESRGADDEAMPEIAITITHH